MSVPRQSHELAVLPASGAPQSRRSRRAFLTLAALSLATPLAACRGSAPQPAQGPETPAGILPPRQPVTILLHVRPGPVGHTGWYMDQRPVFEQQFPTIKVEFDEVTGISIAERMLILHAAGSIGDAGFFSPISDGGGDPMYKGVYRPLEEIIKADRFDLRPFWKSGLAMVSDQGKLYGIPVVGHFGSNLCYVNLELAEKAGVRIPLQDAGWTTDDLIAAAMRMTRPESGEWGWRPSLSFLQDGVHHLRTFGGDFYSPDGRRCIIDSNESVAALQWLADAQYRFRVTETLTGSPGAGQLFEQGKLAMIQSTPGLVAEYSKPGQQRVTFRWGVTVLPKGPTGKRGTQANVNAFGITTLSRQPESAWTWIKFITSRDKGVEQVPGGAGSPGARHDVWSDERLHRFHPIYALIQKVYDGTPGPMYLPANHRYFETVSEANRQLGALWRNEGGAREVAIRTAEAVSRILAQPAP